MCQIDICTIPHLVLNVGSHGEKNRIYHWNGEEIEIYSDIPLARDATHQLNDAHPAEAATDSNHHGRATGSTAQSGCLSVKASCAFPRERFHELWL